MGKAIALRADHGADELRRLARASRDAAQARRLLALAVIHDGGSRSEAARVGGVTLQIVRDWVLRFNAEGPAGLIDRKAPGKPPRLTSEQRAALAQAVEAGPEPDLHGVVRWRLVDLARWLRDEFDVSSGQTLGRELHRMRKLSARPQDRAHPEALEAFSGGDPGDAASGNPDRALVAGRGSRRPEERDHAQMGTARNPAPRFARPAHDLGLHLRRHLPGQGQGGGLGDALRQHRGDAGASRADQRRRRSGRARRPHARPSGLAHVDPARRPTEAAAAPVAGAEPTRKHLAVPARQLALQPRLRGLRRRRPLLRRGTLVAEPARITSIGFRAWAHGF